MAMPATNRSSQQKIALGVVGLGLGGLAPLVTGLIGMWSYATQGYFVSKTGDLIEGPFAMAASGVFVLLGLGMIGYAIWLYRRGDPKG